MTGLDLSSYVSRSRALCAASPPASVHETRTLLVDPLLETLDWDVHAPSTRADVSVDDCALEYVLPVDGVPALFVAVDPYDESLAEERGLALLEAMRWSDVDRAIYTNGRSFLFLAGTSETDRFACRLSELPERTTDVVDFTRSALAAHLADRGRSAVARTLALERRDLVASIVEQVSTRVDHRTDASTFVGPTERFVDQLIVSFASDHPALESGSGDAPRDVTFEFVDASAGGDESPVTEPGASSAPNAAGPEADHRSEQDAPSAADADSSDLPASRWTTAGEQPASNRSSADSGASAASPPTEDAESSPETDGEPGEPVKSNRPAGRDGAGDSDGDSTDGGDSADDGEYVVRFFNDRGSIGAIGGSSSAGGLVYATEYLLGHGLKGVSLPWGPDEGPTVLNDDPTRADGSPMVNPTQLSNGWYLELGGDRDDHRARVEQLASRAGLRAMVTGDWESDGDADG
ncbi:hypothetical protein [Natrarchaeobaculum aegyptiacum]|uniref:Type I restriction enzyme R protein N-terminal domain-containing protein n=1 Tax=Natrarchaeobaculum aegyptiacum TaxID=745377 RepID=A0A2Z2HPC7_9EURY|nr:hypothetical protein [Natrarchaeobaculum aegyptiacum]ARS88869.1 hypothetical protein B1756_03270 [Natrarchaeobaculum aegyptiacum]